MFIDTHAHLNFKAFNKNLEDTIDKAKKAGIDKIIIPGAKIDSSRKAVEISQKYDDCFAAIGIHPHHIDEFTVLGKSNIEEELNLFIKNKKTVAIGEIGLDYHIYRGYPPISDENKKYQKELLLLQIELAQENYLPIIFHCRDAYNDQLDLINNNIRSTSKNIKGVFHCFGGDKNHLKEILDMGFYIGLDGNITYHDSKVLQELVLYTPLDRILLETDSPYLAPIPYRGQRNEPSYLTKTAEFISNLLNVSIFDLADHTSNNALKLFSLPE